MRSTIVMSATVCLVPEPKVAKARSNFAEWPSLIFTEQTCRFPARSKSGNACIILLYDYDAIEILA